MGRMNVKVIAAGLLAAGFLLGAVALVAAATPDAAPLAYISNRGDNTVSVIDTMPALGAGASRAATKAGSWLPRG
jgi:hypothetical protein